MTSWSPLGKWVKKVIVFLRNNWVYLAICVLVFAYIDMSFPTPPGYKPGGITSFLVKRDGNDGTVGLAVRPQANAAASVAVPRRRPGRPPMVRPPPQPPSQLLPGDSGGEAIYASDTVGDSPEEKPLRLRLYARDTVALTLSVLPGDRLRICLLRRK